jgi:hypothetical protein
MNYISVFDVSKEGLPWQIPAFFILFCIGTIGFLTYMLRKLRGQIPLSGYRAVSTIAFLVGLGLVIGSIMQCEASYREYESARQLLQDPDTRVIEGMIHDFHQMPPGGHAIESFTINGIKFQYGTGWGSVIFNSNWNSGFLHDGVTARITYSGDKILRIEIAR